MVNALRPKSNARHIQPFGRYPASRPYNVRTPYLSKLTILKCPFLNPVGDYCERSVRTDFGAVEVSEGGGASLPRVERAGRSPYSQLIIY